MYLFVNFFFAAASFCLWATQAYGTRGYGPLYFAPPHGIPGFNNYLFNPPHPLPRVALEAYAYVPSSHGYEPPWYM